MFREVADAAGNMVFEWYRTAHPHEIADTGCFILLDEIISESELHSRLGEDDERDIQRRQRIF